MSRVIIECSIFMSCDALFHVITSSVDCNSENVFVLQDAGEEVRRKEQPLMFSLEQLRRRWKHRGSSRFPSTA